MRLLHGAVAVGVFVAVLVGLAFSEGLAMAFATDGHSYAAAPLLVNVLLAVAAAGLYLWMAGRRSLH